MARQFNKGSTLIELMISTAIISVIMVTVYSVWRAGNASAHHCVDMSRDTDAAFIFMNNLNGQLEKLAKTGNNDIPLHCSYSGTRYTLSLFSHVGLWHDDIYPIGPFIIKYSFDKETGKLWYYQKPEIRFAINNSNINDYELIAENIQDFSIEYQNNDNWKMISNNTIGLDEIELIKASITQKDNNKENVYSIIVDTF